VGFEFFLDERMIRTMKMAVDCHDLEGWKMVDWEKEFVLVPICLYVKWCGGGGRNCHPPLTVTNKFTTRTFVRFGIIHTHIHLCQVSTRKKA
jgi:hypothetical protein